MRFPALRHHIYCLVLLTASLITGCAAPPKPSSVAGMPVRTGRLSLKVEQEPSAQSFIVTFELAGNAHDGTLRLFSPLGSTLAHAQWTPAQAVLQHGGNTHTFDSLDALLASLTGAPLPAAALFDWLDGIHTEMAGWKADLSQYTQGRIRAQRQQPPPVATLQLVLQ